MRTLAELLEPTQTETPYGGQVTSYEILGLAWLAVGPRQMRERTEEGLGRSFETLEAVVRTDPRLTEGRVLRFGGADWTIRQTDPDADRPGRATLKLERSR